MLRLSLECILVVVQYIDIHVSGTYQYLRQGGFLYLPHKSTLLKYTGFTDMPTGCNSDVISKVLKDIDVESMEPRDHNVALLFDEMRIKSGLVFSKATGKLVGFCDMGNVNNELNKFDKYFKGSAEAEMATHVLTLMARGLFKHFNYPVAYYASVGFSSHQLYPVVWDVVRVLEGCDIHVRAFVCDGASPNRKFFRIHKTPLNYNVSTDGVIYWTLNRFNEGARIYFICDAPHLIKTVRDNIE